MNVYIVADYSSKNDECTEVKGVFSTREKAEAYCAENNLTLEDSKENWYGIDKFIIDKPETV